MRTLHINGMTPPALAIAIALKEKGLAFTITQIDWRETVTAFARFSDSPEITATLEGEFPILVDGTSAVSDSYFVLEYLDDAYPAPRLRPSDAHGQWQLQALARFFGERALPAVSTLGVAQAFGGGAAVKALFENATALTSERRDAWLAAAEPTSQSAIEESRRKLGLLFERLEVMLDGGRPWLLGQDYTLSDIAAFALVHPFLDGSLRAEGLATGEALRFWHERVLARPAIQAALTLAKPAFLPGPEHARWG
jgi:GST-like protein